MFKGLISFIIPVFNCEAFLSQCFGSLLNQTVKDFEIVVIDDGSTDNSLATIQKFEKKFKYFVLIKQKKHGPSFSRNIGVQKSNGKYISFLDADDYVSNKFIETILTRINDNPDIIRFNYFYVSKIGMKQSKENITQKDDIKSLILNDQIGNQVWRNVYKKELIKDIKFEDGRIWEDLLWTYKPFYKANSIKLIDDCLYYYRCNENGISYSTKAEKSTYAIFYGFKIRLEFAQKKGLCKNYEFLLHKAFQCAINALIYQKRKTNEYNEVKTFIRTNKKHEKFTLRFFIVYHFNWIVKGCLRIKRL